MGSARGQVGVSQGSARGQVGVSYTAIVFTVFETFLNGQTVFRYVRNTLKQCSKARGHQGVMPGFARGSARGHQGVR